MNVFIKREYDYALRICTYLAEFFQVKTLPLSKITNYLHISRPFASKIVHKLRKADLLGTVQGKFGGIYLKKDPNDISVMDVFQAMDFDSTLNECIQNHEVCPFVGDCAIHTFFNEQEDKLFAAFRDKRLVDFIFNKKRRFQLKRVPTDTQQETI
ncbi:MAG: Rrf2 family transcriptional regulator [Caldithrix sp.]|nr:Rrf2 family transcriptional regulator [Caldithrix sp.]